MLTDNEIQALLKMEKACQSSRVKWTAQRKSRQCDIELASTDGVHQFILYLRQNTINPASFSCGIVLRRKHLGLEDVTLVRYNGSDHGHDNPFEKDAITFSCHIHLATERYQASRYKSEHYAVATTEYTDFKGAASCLLANCHITGLQLPQLFVQGDMFNG